MIHKFRKRCYSPHNLPTSKNRKPTKMRPKITPVSTYTKIEVTDSASPKSIDQIIYSSGIAIVGIRIKRRTVRKRFIRSPLVIQYPSTLKQCHNNSTNDSGVTAWYALILTRNLLYNQEYDSYKGEPF